MRILLLSIVLFLSACCNIKEEQLIIPAHSKKVVVKLMDSLGLVTLYIPERYDTAFAWVHESDCSTCDHMKCRFQSQRNRIFMENGFFPFGMSRDSLDQLTIVYSPHLYDMRDGDTSWLHQQSVELGKKAALEGRTAEHVLINTCITIHDRPFAVIGIRNYVPRAKRFFCEFTAVTAVRGKAISFEFEVVQEKEDTIIRNFVPDAIDIIKTIRFSTPV
jgi:hypothetical protein